jgi:hypothetical protein
LSIRFAFIPITHPDCQYQDNSFWRSEWNSHKILTIFLDQNLRVPGCDSFDCQFLVVGRTSGNSRKQITRINLLQSQTHARNETSRKSTEMVIQLARTLISTSDFLMGELNG